MYASSLKVQKNVISFVRASLMFLLLAALLFVCTFVSVFYLCIGFNLHKYVSVSLLSLGTPLVFVFRYLLVCLFALQDTTFNNHGPQTPPSQIRPQGTQEPSSLQETPPLQAQGQEALSPPPQEEVLFRLSGNDIFMIICKPDFHPGDSFSSCSSYYESFGPPIQFESVKYVC